MRADSNVRLDIKTAHVFLISDCSAVRKHPLELLTHLLVFLVMFLTD